MKTLLVSGSLLVAAVALSPVVSQTRAKPAVAAGTGKPQLGSFGVDLTSMDTAVAPGDDFYEYVNGAWSKRTEIPADRASWGAFAVLRDLSDQRTRQVIEDSAKASNAPGSVGAKIGATYATFMDEAAVEAKGAAPLKPYLAAIAAIQTPADLARAFAHAELVNITVPVGLGVQQDLKQNDRYAVYLGQGGLGLPDRDYYLSADAKMAEIRAKYVPYIVTMLRLGGLPDPEGAAQRIFALEKTIAETHVTRAELRIVEKRYNPFAAADLPAKMPGFDWAAYLQGNKVGGEARVIVAQPETLTRTAAIIAATPLSTWREYLAFHTIDDSAPLLSSAFVNAHFAFRGAVLTGVPRLKDRWKRGVDLVNGGLGEAVGELYVARYFPPDAKAKADDLVKNLVAAMDIRLSKLEWMAPETKAKARVKLAAFTPKIGYPGKWRDYSALNIVAGDLLGNAVRMAEFEFYRNIAKLGRPVDRGEWLMTPQTVNAYANPPMNEIVFPAAILQPPFFDPNADPAVNYGGIGAVIGHEISHHFDDQGRKFDPKGNFSDWWTADDVTRFKRLTDKVVAQYGAYEPIPGLHVNGELTLGENMADLAGINMAYDAYRISLKGKPAPVIDGLTGDQRFFLGYAQIWQNKTREAALRQQIATDPHSPAALRPYVARNLDPWYAAFKVKAGQKLYLVPADRIRVW